ncbi:MAG TPA: hypothetical protein VGH43_09770 [Jatrophihabitans sp.]
MTQPPHGQQPEQPPGQGEPYQPQQPPAQGEPYQPEQSGSGSTQSGEPGYGQNQPGYGQSQPAPGQGQYSQSQYGQNQYPQNQYGQQSYGAAPAAMATSKGRFNVVAGVLAGIAAILGILSLFVFGWYRDNYRSVSGGNNASSSSKFSKLHDSLGNFKDQADSHPSIGRFLHFGISPTYFGWLGYLLIIAAVVLAFVAAAPLGGAVVAVKFLAALVALAGLGLTLWAIDLIAVDKPFVDQYLNGQKAPSYLDYLKHTSFGAWAMLLAFLLCFIAALLPPKRKTYVTTAPGSARY